MMNLIVCLILFIVFSINQKLTAQIILDSTKIEITTISSSLDVPWEISVGPDGDLWVTERYGRISKINTDTKNQIPLTVIPDVYQQQESGLLGMALHPDFENTPFLYVVYTYLKSGEIKEKVVRYTYEKDTLNTPNILIDNIPANSYHNGSRLLILPDKTMLITTGDAGNASSSQDIHSVSGKILRINLDGTIPLNNPIINNLAWTWGHRNAQGLCYGPNGILFSSEHGPTSDDEINTIEKGRNYGWPNVNGFCDTPMETTICNNLNVKEPIYVWTPTIAPSGMIYYNHPAIPEWRNSLLLTVLKGKQLKQLILNENNTSITEEKSFIEGNYGRLRAITTDKDGAIYIATNGESYGNANPFTHKIIKIYNPNYVSILPEQINPEIRIINDFLNNTFICFTSEMINKSFEIIDCKGVVIHKERIVNQKMNLNKLVSFSGVYVIRVTIDNKTWLGKVLITN